MLPAEAAASSSPKLNFSTLPSKPIPLLAPSRVYSSDGHSTLEIGPTLPFHPSPTVSPHEAQMAGFPFVPGRMKLLLSQCLCSCCVLAWNAPPLYTYPSFRSHFHSWLFSYGFPDLFLYLCIFASLLCTINLGISPNTVKYLNGSCLYLQPISFNHSFIHLGKCLLSFRHKKFNNIKGKK